MVQWYRRANHNWPKLLWWIVVVSLLLTLPIAADRYRTEHTSKKVELVFDYRDLLEISDTKPNPRAFAEEQLKRMKQSGIGSLAVYESTLNELKLARRVELYNSHDATALTQTPAMANDNFTYVLFTDREAQPVVQGLVEEAFREQGVTIRPWSYKNTPGLILELPLDDAAMKPMAPDPIALKALKEKGFDLVVRLGNRRAYSGQIMERLLQQLSSYDVKTVLMDGESVPGYTPSPAATKHNLEQLADLLRKYGIAVAVIEPVSLKVPQKGMTTLAKETGYQVVRLHSISEQEAAKLAENITAAELDGRIKGMADRLALAVKDRNIRMIFLNAKPNKNLDRGVYTDPLEPLYKSLTGERGAVSQIKDAGYSLGRAHPFTIETSGLSKLVRPFAYIGAIALLALTLSYFVPGLSLLATGLGLLGGGAIYVLSPVLAEKLLALGTTVCASALGIIAAIRYFRRRSGEAPERGAVWKAAGLLFVITGVSALGIASVVGLLSDITYVLQIDQFKGVKILAYMPIVLATVYLVFFSEDLRPAQRLDKVRRILESKISVLWIVCVAVIGAVGMYYLSRTGNEGAASSYELLFRNFLENTLGVRPRTKEFLLAHPLLVFGAYLCLKRRAAGLYIMLAGAIGQASVVGTFTHLHMPLWISFLRVVLGVGFGLALGLLLILAWEIGSRGWNQWVRPLRR